MARNDLVEDGVKRLLMEAAVMRSHLVQNRMVVETLSHHWTMWHSIAVL